MKTQQLESTEFEANELSKIIEKSQEKLEKMEVSKNLAIDIAKQLVSKYDEIKNSKNKLIDRLQMVEVSTVHSPVLFNSNERKYQARCNTGSSDQEV